MIFGYFRLDPSQRDNERKREEFIDALRAARCMRIEVDDDGRRNRLKQILDDIGHDDVFVSPSIPALALSLRDLLMISDRVKAKKGGFRLLAEKIDTSRPGVWHTLGELAAYESRLSETRVRTGVAQAQLEGRPRGRPAKLTPSQIETACREVGGGKGFAALAREMGVHPTTIMRAVRDRQGEV